MSKLVDFDADDIKQLLGSDEVTEQIKQELTKKLVESILPNVKTAADNFVTEIKEQGKNETGWCKLRDMVVLPLVINAGLYVVEKVLSKTLEKTTEEE